jgi:hypothetical protein
MLATALAPGLSGSVPAAAGCDDLSAVANTLIETTEVGRQRVRLGEHAALRAADMAEGTDAAIPQVLEESVIGSPKHRAVFQANHRKPPEPIAFFIDSPTAPAAFRPVSDLEESRKTSTNLASRPPSALSRSSSAK